MLGEHHPEGEDQQQRGPRNRDTRAIQLRLDEILRAHESARSDPIEVECLEDEEPARVEDEIVELRDT